MKMLPKAIVKPDLALVIHNMKNVLILGSGRSGTSMVTGALAKNGYFLGENPEYLGKNQSNPKGFFEDREVNTINEDILSKSLINFPERLRRRFFPSYTFYRARWLARLPLSYFPKSDETIDKRIEQVVSKKPFCYKDPRFSYTLPYWKKFLPENTLFLVVYRHPSLTARSIQRECEESPALQKLKMSHNIALKVWRLMYSHILKTYSDDDKKQNWAFVHYDQMYKENKINSLESFLQVKIDTGFAEKKFSRSGESFGEITQKEKEIYSQLNRLSAYKTL